MEFYRKRDADVLDWCLIVPETMEELRRCLDFRSGGFAEGFRIPLGKYLWCMI